MSPVYGNCIFLIHCLKQQQKIQIRKFKLYAEQSGANENYLPRIATLDNSWKCHCGFQVGNYISVLKGNKLDREGLLVTIIPHATTTIK